MKLLILSTYPVTLRRIRHIDTRPIHLNYTGMTWNTVVRLLLIPYRLPMPRPGEVLGLVGTNGIGKSTALKILAGKQKPNLGKFSVS